MSKMSKTSFDQLQVVFSLFSFSKWLYMAEMPSSYCSASPRVKIAPHGEPKMSKMSKTSFDQLQVVFFFLFVYQVALYG